MEVLQAQGIKKMLYNIMLEVYSVFIRKIMIFAIIQMIPNKTIDLTTALKCWHHNVKQKARLNHYKSYHD